MDKKRPAERKIEDSEADINFGSQIRNTSRSLPAGERSALENGHRRRGPRARRELNGLMHAYLVWKHTGRVAGDDKDNSAE